MHDNLEEVESHERAKWLLSDYVKHPCPNCGRMRLCQCPNGSHRCEKCNWSPELNGYVPAND